jgi:hypothetical protein
MASSAHLLEMSVDLTLKRSQDQNRSNRRLGWPDPRHCVAAPPPLRGETFSLQRLLALAIRIGSRGADGSPTLIKSFGFANEAFKPTLTRSWPDVPAYRRALGLRW